MAGLSLAACIMVLAGCGGGAADSGAASVAKGAPAAVPATAPAAALSSALQAYAQDYTLTRVGWYSYDATHSTVPVIANVQTSLDDNGAVSGYFTIEACAGCAYTFATGGTPTYSDISNYCMGRDGRMACPSWDTASNATGTTAGVQVLGMPTYNPDAAVPVYHAFGGTTDLGTLGGASSYATGINLAGQVVGYSNVAGASGTQAFLFRDGVMQALALAGATQSQANAINAAGQIAGNLTPAGSAVAHGFFYTNGTFTDLGEGEASALNDSGQVAGSNSAGAYLTASSGRARRAIGPGAAAGVNAAGQVVINGAGPFLWDGAAQVNLNTIIAPTDPLAGAVTLTTVIAINRSGQILVNGYDNAGWQLQFLLTPPPLAAQLARLLAIAQQLDDSAQLAALVAQAQRYSGAGDAANTCLALGDLENDFAARPGADPPETTIARLQVDVHVMMSTVGCTY